MEKITSFKIPPPTPKNGRLRRLESSTASTRPAPRDAGRVASTRSCSGSEVPEPGPPRLCAGRNRRRRRSATPGMASGERYVSVDCQPGPRHTSPASFLGTPQESAGVLCRPERCQRQSLVSCAAMLVRSGPTATGAAGQLSTVSLGGGALPGLAISAAGQPTFCAPTQLVLTYEWIEDWHRAIPHQYENYTHRLLEKFVQRCDQ
jgi:hypothetical protein